jgi:hypothetical protein
MKARSGWRYGQQQLPRLCADLQMTASPERPDAAVWIGGRFSQTTGGEVRFSCGKGDVAMEAALRAAERRA